MGGIWAPAIDKQIIQMGEKVVDSEAGPTERALVLGLEQRPWEFRLSNDAPQGSTSDRIVKGHRNG
jgi:hypothetical protein